MQFLLPTLIFLCFITLASALCPVQQVALYRITLTGEWTPESSSPTGYPGNPSCQSGPYFGHLIGATHNISDDTAYLWENAGYATPGFDRYVSGQYTGYLLREEIRYAINHTGKFHDLIYIPQTLPIDGTEYTDVYINYTNAFVDIAVSIVPSPDWFVGVSKLPLFEQGHWYKYIAIDLYAWDAGTQIGNDLAVSQGPRYPHARMSSLRNKYPFGVAQKPLGVLIFERLDADDCIQNGETYHSWQLKELVSLTVSNSTCFAPISPSNFTSAGQEIPSQGCVVGSP